MLMEYGVRRPAEARVVGRFVEFVGEHPRCFERDCWAGHVTGSAWLVNESKQAVLLTHHKKLGRWLQVGGHSDGEGDTLQVAVREAREESGLVVEVLDRAIFDVDIHKIPARKSDPAHYHFDLRFALVAAGGEAFQVSEESHALAWAPIDDLRAYTQEESVLRMARKWLVEEHSKYQA
jgi:8-oxo-dGTP pyrophosphatase MutT (NUDIX family)